MTTKDVLMNIANVVIRIRKIRGLTQTELANMCGLTRDMIASIELGRSTALDNIITVCNILDIKLKAEVDMNNIELKKQF